MAADLMGVDLAVLRPVAATDATQADLIVSASRSVGILAPGATQAYDLLAAGGRTNLAQALLLRLLTPLGSLATLGHPGYGSRLHLLVGQRKNGANRALCKMYVLEAAAQEPRVEPKAVAVVFHPDEETADSFVLTLEVQPVDETPPVGLTLGVSL